MKNIYIFLFLSISSLSIKAQSPENLPDDIITTFFIKYEKDNMEALNYLFESNKWMNESNEQVDNLKSQLVRTTQLLGEYYGYELLVKKKINQLELHTYFIKYDRQPLRFSILFYKPNKEWRLQNFSFDDKLDTELETSVQIEKIIDN